MAASYTPSFLALLLVANPWWPAQNIVGVSYVEADHHAFALAPCNLLLNDEGRGSFRMLISVTLALVRRRSRA